MGFLKTNYHTHTNFCDGKDSPEEIVLAAIEKKFDVLGFSSHTMFPFVEYGHIAASEHKNYVAEVRRVAQKYEDKIEVLCGFEAEFLPGIALPRFDKYAQFDPDYLIGSVHFVVTEDGYFAVDDSAEKVRSGIDKYFGGDACAAVSAYFDFERQMLRKGDFTIIGHCDLFRKRNKVLRIFDENESWYRKEIAETAKEIARAGVIAEINTGGIVRGAMDGVYPSAEFLSLLCQNKVPVTINSDAHDKNYLDADFDIAVQAAKRAGYTEVAVLTRNKSGTDGKKTDVKMQRL